MRTWKTQSGAATSAAAGTATAARKPPAFPRRQSVRHVAARTQDRASVEAATAPAIAVPRETSRSGRGPPVLLLLEKASHPALKSYPLLACLDQSDDPFPAERQARERQRAARRAREMTETEA